MLHEKSLKGKLSEGGASSSSSKPSNAAPAPQSKAKAKAKSKGKDGKGKGKGKQKSGSQSSDRSASAGSASTGERKKRTFCAWFQVGKCPGNCGFEHEYVHSQRLIDRLKRLRESGEKQTKDSPRSPSPAGRKPDCYSWVNKGFCDHEGTCRYAHDPARKGRGVAAPVATDESSDSASKKKKKRGGKKRKGGRKKKNSSSSSSADSSTSSA